MDFPAVAITIRSFNRSGPALKALESEFSICYQNRTGRKLDEAGLIAAVRDAEYVIAGTEQFSRRVLDTAVNLRAISRVGVGTDSIDLKAAAVRNIRILTTPEAPAAAVTEHTLALLLAATKRVPKYNENMRKGDFSLDPGILLSGKTAGIVGLGRIGRRFARILSCMGCRVRYFDPYVPDSPDPAWAAAPSLAELVRDADIISLHTPPSPDGTPLIGPEIFAQCRKGMILVNTARGSLVDEAALESALKEGIVGAACLDVFRDEPYTGSLLKYPQVIVTPHVASNTAESREQMEYEAVQNLILAKKGD